MSAFPNPPSTPPLRGSVEPTLSTPVESIETMEDVEYIDLTVSSDDEMVQGPPKKIKLIKPLPAGDAEKDVIPAPTADGITVEDDAPMNASRTENGTFDTNAECLVATPPATSPPPGTFKDVPGDIPDETAAIAGETTTSVPNAVSASDEGPVPWLRRPCSPWSPGHYPVFDPDDECFEFGSFDGDIFTEPYAFKEAVLLVLHYEHRSESTLVENLQDCLRGSALTWYLEELTDKEREDLRDGDVEYWLDALIERFCLDYEEYVRRLGEQALGLEALRHDCDLEEWVESMFTNARPICDGDLEALHLIWEQIDPALREDVPEPDERTEYQDLMENLARAEVKWRKMLGLKPRRW
ncbi:uncharacterized protein N7458_003030 [Penicillium daleae]|uniref:Uncharacterized protein n=1 Tax=Penicillium daleae TaxID=63821 RepID=A0AAD6CFP5_9EURO|nr:uncharacterized protein N7458_003030 [Penicillium daleae]KAJ5461478.1 hypothetical protein N7458_003030 [Penicillium daleae]